MIIQRLARDSSVIGGSSNRGSNLPMAGCSSPRMKLAGGVAAKASGDIFARADESPVQQLDRDQELLAGTTVTFLQPRTALQM